MTPLETILYQTSSFWQDYGDSERKAFASDLSKQILTEVLGEDLLEGIKKAEAALADIGDAEREEGDDVAWCESRALEGLTPLRQAMRLRGLNTTDFNSPTT